MPNRSEKALRLYNEFVDAEDAGDIDEAMDKLNQSVRLGEPMAHHVLAYYEFGKKEPRVAWALRHYRAAANGGFAPSAWNLARHYEKVGKVGQFEKWMRCAARLGDPEAQQELASRGIVPR